MLAPSDPDALVPAVKKAWEARIPVVILDSGLAKGAEAYYQSFLATDNRKAGELAARALIERTGPEGKIAVMSYVAGTGSEVGRVGGFTDYVKAHSKLRIVGPYYSQSQMATALNQTADVLAAHPDLKGLFGANEPTAIGMGRALKQAGRADKVAAVGFDGNQDLQDFVKDGTLAAIVVQGSFRMGELGSRRSPRCSPGRRWKVHRYRRGAGDEGEYRDGGREERAVLSASHERMNPPPSAGEGGPCVSRGRERGSATLI